MTSIPRPASHKADARALVLPFKGAVKGPEEGCSEAAGANSAVHAPSFRTSDGRSSLTEQARTPMLTPECTEPASTTTLMPEPIPDRRHPLDCILVAILALGVYGVLLQQTLYGFDGWWLVQQMASGDTHSDMHVLYLPILALARLVGDGFGLTPFASASWASAISTAIGIGFVHAASQILVADRRDALLTTALVALCPAVLFFATVVERHGVFFGLAGVSCWATAVFIKRPNAMTAAAMGASIALSYAAHSTGILMVAILSPLAIALAPDRVRAVKLQVWASIVVVLGLLAVRELAVGSGQTKNYSTNAQFFWQLADRNLGKLQFLPAVIWHEWLLAFMPLSLAWIAAWFRPGLRAIGGALTLGLLAYLGAAFLLLGDTVERGAYLLPVAWPAAIATVRALPRAASLLVLAIGCMFAVQQVVAHDDHRTDAFAEGFLQVSRDQPTYLLLATPLEFEAVATHFPSIEYWDGVQGGGLPPESMPKALPFFGMLLGNRIAAGQQVILTEGTESYLKHPSLTRSWQAGPLILEYLREHFTHEPIEAGGFRGHRLQPK